jgi:hypothetical protein
LEEVVIRPFNLTGYLEVDTKIIPEKKTIAIVSGLTQGYEGCIFTNAFGRVLGSILIRQICCIIFGNKPKN